MGEHRGGTREREGEAIGLSRAVEEETRQKKKKTHAGKSRSLSPVPRSLTLLPPMSPCLGRVLSLLRMSLVLGRVGTTLDKPRRCSALTRKKREWQEVKEKKDSLASALSHSPL